MILSHAHFWLLLCIVAAQLVAGGHEVLYGVKLDPEKDIQPGELAIVQFDSRALSSYWNVSAHWNHAYASKHGHQYAYFTMPHGDECSIQGIALSPAWCKVKAMLLAQEHLPTAKAFLYLDSDAVVTTDLDYSLTDVLAYARQDLGWDTVKQPVAFNQDGPGWACTNTLATTTYDFCLNSGTVFWRRGFVAQRILADWWAFGAMDYDVHKVQFTQLWRSVWPWEQGPQHAIYDKYRGFIMRLSFPHQTHLPWTSTKKPTSQYPTDLVEPWCFSHWPGAGCFITHFCASMNQKKRMMREYLVQADVERPEMSVFFI